MILHLTDTEAYALSLKLQASTTTIDLGEGGIGERAEIDPVALASAIVKLEAGMRKSDEKLTRTLDSAISSLTASGFATDQLEALTSARSKANDHNQKKYFSKEEGKLK